MKFSLRTLLTSLWLLIVLFCVGLAYVLNGLYDQSISAQLRQADQRLTRAADDLVARYERYRVTFNGQTVPLNDPTALNDLPLLTGTALAPFPGVEGGFWREGRGSVAYAFPTYEGDAAEKDAPAAEMDRIASIVAEAKRAGKDGAASRYVGRREAVLLRARLLATGRAKSDLSLWVMTRVPVSLARPYEHLTGGLAVLGVLALGSGLWLAGLLRSWSQRVGRLETAIATTPLEALTALPETGGQELDRLVTAFNALNARLQATQANLARADRLAALGRMSAGLAHEIGNPLAAMRLRAENALEPSANPERQTAALRIILSQIARLEELTGRLRFLTRMNDLRPRSVALRTFLQHRLDELEPAARQAGVELALDPAPPAEARWEFDERSLERAVDNLLLNALQHTPAGGRVTLGTELSANRCRFLVRDTGPGVPAADAERIFEPFVTGRDDGVGLGLSLVREVAGAHGGSVRCEPLTDPTERGARFVLELPAPLSANVQPAPTQ